MPRSVLRLSRFRNIHFPTCEEAVREIHAGYLYGDKESLEPAKRALRRQRGTNANCLTRLEEGDDGLALYDKTYKYRYVLTRRWDPWKPNCLFIMLNPSTASAFTLDPTVTRCLSRAKDAGAGSMTVVNLFAYRSTDPMGLVDPDDPVGRLNDGCILTMMGVQEMRWTVAAWGTTGKLNGRGTHITKLLQQHGIPSYCLGKNKDGSPKHPLYISYDQRLEPLW